jgi:hypothetical protein
MSNDAEVERLMNVLRTAMRLLELSNPEPAPAPAVELTSEEIDRRIREAVRRAFQELAATSYPPTGGGSSSSQTKSTFAEIAS